MSNEQFYNITLRVGSAPTRWVGFTRDMDIDVIMENMRYNILAMRDACPPAVPPAGSVVNDMRMVPPPPGALLPTPVPSPAVAQYGAPPSENKEGPCSCCTEYHPDNMAQGTTPCPRDENGNHRTPMPVASAPVVPVLPVGHGRGQRKNDYLSVMNQMVPPVFFRSRDPPSQMGSLAPSVAGIGAVLPALPISYIRPLDRLMLFVE